MILGDDNEQLFHGLIDIILKWKPQIYSGESQYQKALYDHLKNLQERGTIKEERTIRREGGESRADLRVSNVAIELKKELNSKSQRDRAENQIRLMLKEFDFVIVVIVGNNKKEAVDTFKHHLKDFIVQGDILGNSRKSLKVIEVGKDRGNNENAKGRDDGEDPFGLNIRMPDIKMPEIKMPRLF